MTEVVVNKGYTVEVKSWENDGDYTNVKKMTVESKELAVALVKMCTTLFCSKNSEKKGIGNSNYEYDKSKIRTTILSYLENNKEDFELFLNYLEGEESVPNLLTENDKINIVMEINFQLLGGTEYYYSRVCESCKIYYSPEDVVVNLVEYA